MRSTLGVLVLALFAGCAGGGRPKDPNEQYRVNAAYDAADAQGPASNLEGQWLTEDYSELLTIRQTGDRATGVLAGGKNTFQAEVKGRVCAGIDQTRFAFTMAPDGQKGILHIGQGRFPAWRFVLGPAAKDPRTAKDPLLSGGVIFRLPFTQAGQVNQFANQHSQCTLRDAVVLWREFDHGYRTSMSTTFEIIPLEEGLKPAFVMKIKGNQYVHYYTDLISVDDLRKARSNSPVLAKRPVKLDGRDAWIMLVPQWNPAAADRAPVIYHAEIYEQDPDETGAMPVESITGVAFNAGEKGWHTAPKFVRLCKKPTKLNVTMDGGVPARVDLAEVADPRLEDFWMVQGTSSAEMRWYTTQLTIHRVKGLTRLLRDSTTDLLKAHLEGIEQFILGLTRMDSSHKNLIDTLQAANKDGQHKAQIEETEMKIAASRERIEALKPILAAIKEEVANRQR